ncbi:hypothetical protein H9P43_007647 [Blastocladiella emersonii ATCC 22665]|nr:hypothetical protein H9P43_007647 [Blastocladiella emersonii ATCC 22665]
MSTPNPRPLLGSPGTPSERRHSAPATHVVLTPATPSMLLTPHLDTASAVSSNTLAGVAARSNNPAIAALRRLSVGDTPTFAYPITAVASRGLPRTTTAEGESGGRVRWLYTRVPAHPGDLRVVRWRLKGAELACLDSDDDIVVAFHLSELVWAKDGVFGIEFGVDHRVYCPCDEIDADEMEWDNSATPRVPASVTSTSSSLDHVVDHRVYPTIERGNGAGGGDAGEQDEEEDADERADAVASLVDLVARAQSASSAATAAAAVAPWDVLIDHPLLAGEHRMGEAAGYVEGFRVYSEDAMEMTRWWDALSAFRTAHPLVPLNPSPTTASTVGLAGAEFAALASATTLAMALASSTPTSESVTLSTAAVNGDHATIPLPLAPCPTADTDAASSHIPLASAAGLAASTSETASKFAALEAATHPLGGPAPTRRTSAVSPPSHAGSGVTVASNVDLLDVRDSIELTRERRGSDGVVQSPTGSSTASSVGDVASPPTVKIHEPAKEVEEEEEGLDSTLNADELTAAVAAVKLQAVAQEEKPAAVEEEPEEVDVLGDTLEASATAQLRMRIKTVVSGGDANADGATTNVAADVAPWSAVV